MSIIDKFLQFLAKNVDGTENIDLNNKILCILRFFVIDFFQQPDVLGDLLGKNLSVWSPPHPPICCFSLDFFAKNQIISQILENIKMQQIEDCTIIDHFMISMLTNLEEFYLPNKLSRLSIIILELKFSSTTSGF